MRQCQMFPRLGPRKTTPTERTQQLRTLFRRDWCGRCDEKGAKPLILRRGTRFCLRPHPVATLEAHPKWQNVQIDQVEWIHPTHSSKHKFSVIVDEGCHLKVAEMLFPMKDTVLHRNHVWTELYDFYLEQWVCYFGNPTRVRVDSEGCWMSEAAAAFFGKESVLLEPIRFPNKRTGRQDLWRRQCVVSRPQ